MRFDDRLLTVLNQPAGDRHDAAVRWRQLVDLVARAGSNSAQPDDRPRRSKPSAPTRRTVDENLRAAAARAVAALPLPLGLLEYFASDSLAVSAPVLAAATLDPASGARCCAVADDETRRFIETLHPELAPAHAPRSMLTDALVEQARAADQPAAAAAAGPVAERGRRPDRAPPPQPHGLASRCGAGRGAPPGIAVAVPLGMRPERRNRLGRGAPRGPLIGRSIARAQEGGDRVDQEVVRAFAMRAPFRDAALMVAGEGLVAGRVEDQRRAGVRARRRPLRRLSRGRAARRAGAPPRAKRLRATCSPTRIRCASWSTRSRRRSTRSSALPRSSTASISARPTAATASARPRSSPRPAAADRDRRSRFRRQGPFADRDRAAARVDLGAAARADGAVAARAARRRAASSSSCRATARRRRGARSSRSSPTG